MSKVKKIGVFFDFTPDAKRYRLSFSLLMESKDKEKQLPKEKVNGMEKNQKKIRDQLILMGDVISI